MESFDVLHPGEAMQTAGAPELTVEAAGARPERRRFRPTRAMWLYLAGVAVLYASALVLGLTDEASAGSRPPEGIAGALWSGHREAAAMLAELLPYWLAGMLVGAALTVFLSWDQPRSRLGAGGFRANLVAASAGAVVPICSCSVVPVLAGMVGAGVPLGPATAFLIAAPMVNAQSVLLTAGALGWPLAVARVAATFAIALAAGGLLARWQARQGELGRLLRLPDLVSTSTGGSSCSRLPAGAAARTGWSGKVAELFRSALRRFIELNGYLLLAVGLAVAIRLLVPERWIAAAVGGSGLGSVVTAAALAIPVYVCTYAEVPTAVALASKGMGPGATLAYLLGGPGLSAASIAMLSAVFRPRVLALYAALSFGGCVLAGWIYNLLA
jgi:uncharacterized membrane protein YraQ (UPF0718 family)